jgi:hypothetical protein
MEEKIMVIDMLARTKQELSNLIMEKEDMSQIVSLIV